MFKQLFYTKIGWLLICCILVIIFGTLGNWFEWCQYAMFICLAYPIGMSFVMIFYAFKNMFNDLW